MESSIYRICPRCICVILEMVLSLHDSAVSPHHRRRMLFQFEPRLKPHGMTYLQLGHGHTVEYYVSSPYFSMGDFLVSTFSVLLTVFRFRTVHRSHPQRNSKNPFYVMFSNFRLIAVRLPASRQLSFTPLHFTSRPTFRAQLRCCVDGTAAAIHFYCWDGIHANHHVA